MDELLAAVDILRLLCRHSYGPSGEQVLVFAPPDPPLITSDGHAVLRAWRQRDGDVDTVRRSPFERVILDAAEGVYREVGDGTTQFVLLLHGVLMHVSNRHLRNDSAFASPRMAAQVQIARAFGELRQRWDAQRLLPSDIESSIVIEQESAQITSWEKNGVWMQTIERILSTALTGLLGDQRATRQFVRLILDWLFSFLHDQQQQQQQQEQLLDPLHFLYRRVQSYLQQAPQAIVHAHGLSFGPSHVIPPNEFLLRKSLLPSQLPSLMARSTTLKFVCFTGSFDLTHGSNQIVFEPTASPAAENVTGRLRAIVKQYLVSLATTHNVGLVVSTEKIPDNVAAACNALQIACVQYAERDDVTALCLHAGIFPLTSVFDMIQDGKHIGVCLHGATVVHLSQTPSIHLRGLVPRRQQTGVIPVVILVPQLIVYAASKGVYKQYYNAILKSLRVLRGLFVSSSSSSSSSPRIRFCRGAGATELAIAKALHQEASAMAQRGHGDLAVRLALEATSSALVESVAQLRSNVMQAATGESRGSCLSSTRVLLEEVSRWHRPADDVSDRSSVPAAYVLDMSHSIPTSLGSICIPTLVVDDPLPFGVLHPWRRIETILHAVFQTAEMLLRVDTIVHVKRNVATSRTGMHDAMADEEEM